MVEDIDPSLEKSRQVRQDFGVDTLDVMLPGPSEAQLGRILRELRCIQGLEPEQLAWRSGLEADVIDALEHGQHGADVATLRRVAVGLGIRVGVIFALWERRALDVERP